MKRLIRGFLCLIICFALPMTVRAEEPLQFLDPSGGCVLTLPEGWRWEPVALSDTAVHVSFHTGSREEPIAQYIASDLWSELSPQEQKDLPRAEFTGRIMNAASVSGYLNTDEKAVASIHLGDREFYYTEPSEASLSEHCWIHIQNGWMYAFRMDQDASPALLQSFRTMLEEGSFGSEEGSTVFAQGSGHMTLRQDPMTALEAAGFLAGRWESAEDPDAWLEIRSEEGALLRMDSGAALTSRLNAACVYQNGALCIRFGHRTSPILDLAAADENTLRVTHLRTGETSLLLRK